jgi:hypothetical protein
LAWPLFLYARAIPVKWLVERNCPSSIILMSGYGGKYIGLADKLGSARGANIVGTLTKPMGLEELKTMLKKIMDAK